MRENREVRRFAHSAAGDMAFRLLGQRRHPEPLISRLNSPACTTPTDASPPPSRTADARLRATVDRYSFDVENSHLLLHAGLSRRFPRLRSPRKPLSRSTDRKAGPGQQPSTTQFHAPNSESAGRDRRSLTEGEVSGASPA